MSCLQLFHLLRGSIAQKPGMGETRFQKCKYLVGTVHNARVCFLRYAGGSALIDNEQKVARQDRNLDIDGNESITKNEHKSKFMGIVYLIGLSE